MNDKVSNALPVARIFWMPSVPLANTTVSVPIFFTVGLETIRLRTTFTSLSRCSRFPVSSPPNGTESVAAELKCDVG